MLTLNSMPEKQYKYQMYTNCFIGCPYQRQCGVAITSNFQSCIDQIKVVIPEASRLVARPLDKVLVFNSENKHIVTINKGEIIEI